jgi:hypothetical protein
MQRHLQRLVPGWVGMVGAVGAFLAATALSGCPGTLDPTLLNAGSGGTNGSGSGGNGSGGNGTGGNNSSGGSTGSGGSSSSGGSNGSGGSSSSCTGSLDPTNIIMTQCATVSCHDSADANTSGAGLDLTVNSSIGSRLVGVTSPGNTVAGSQCAGNTEPYLKSGSNPATGLLIQKIQSSPKCSMNESPPCCGSSMPYPGVVFLTSQQQTCLIQWATTLTSP